MKNKFLKYSVLAVSGLFMLSSCNINDRFEKLNTNQNNPSTASPSVLLSQVENSTFSTNGGFDDGFIGQFAEHFAGNHATGIEYDLYELNNGSFSNFFTNSYLGSLKDCERIIKTSGAGNEKYVGVAKILTAYRLGYLTSLYGDIPYTEALNPDGTLFPKYDSQESIYATIQTMLAQAVTDLDKGTATLQGDYLYDGDIKKWKAVSYLLSARFYNHFSKKDPAGSATKALAAIDKAKALGFKSNSWNLVRKFEGTATYYNPWVDTFSNGMIVANKPFIDKLVSEGDPRLKNLFCSVNRNGSNSYGLGKKQSGKIGDQEYACVGGDDSAYGQPNSSIPVATYAELLMIEAECALRAGDKPRAANSYNEAIKQDIAAVTGTAASSFPAFVTTKASETDTTITLEKIMTEKHKVMFAISVESWMDFRRHDHKYPTWVSLPLNESETAPANTKYIERILYPQTELNLNGANVPAATIYDKLPILK